MFLVKTTSVEMWLFDITICYFSYTVPNLAPINQLMTFSLIIPYRDIYRRFSFKDTQAKVLSSNSKLFSLFSYLLFCN